MKTPTGKDLCRIIAEQQALISELTVALNAADLALKNLCEDGKLTAVKK